MHIVLWEFKFKKEATNMYVFAIGIIILQIGGTLSQSAQGNFKRVLDFSDPGKIFYLIGLEL